MKGRAGSPGPWLVATLLAVMASSCRTPPSQTYRSIYQTADSAGVDSTSWTNQAELGAQGQPGPGFEYRLDERLVHSDRDLDLDGNDVESTDFLHQPSADVVLAAGALRWIQGFELLENRMRSSGSPDNDLTRKDLRQRLDWTPEGFPQVSTRFDFRTEEDDQFLDRETTEFIAEVDQELGPFDYHYSWLDQRLENLTSSVDTDRNQHLFRGTYQDDHIDGKLTTSVSVFVDDRSNETTTSLAGGETQITLPASAGLSLVDSTPQVSILQPNSALTDGDTLSSAGINIGGFASGGVLDYNIGVELPGPSTIDIIRLVTVDPVDPFLVDQFAFTVWASEDNEFWSLVSSPASFSYSAVDRAFRLSIPPVSSQYLKVVNTVSPAAAGAVLVSEMQVFAITSAAANSKTRVDDSVRNVTSRISYRFLDNLTMSYDLLLQEALTESVGFTTRDQSRVDHGLALQWAPVDIVGVTLRGQHRRTNDAVEEDEEVLFLNGQANVSPLDTLDLNLSYSLTEREEGGLDEIETESAQVGVSARLLETLTAEVVFGLSSQQDFFNQRDLDRTIIAGTLVAELSRTIEMTIGARNEDTKVTGPGAGGITDPSEQRYELTFVFQPTSQLSADATLEWVDTFAGSGLDQRYRLDWIPFRDGKLDLQLNFDRTDANSIANERVDRFQALTRWSLNQRAFLEFNYSTQVPENAERTDLVTASFNVVI